MVSDKGRNHRKHNEEQGAKKQVLDAKNHEDEVKDRDMNQVHAIRVQGNLFGDDVKRHVGGVPKSIDGESEKQAKYPADPELRIVVRISKAVAEEDKKKK